MGTRSPAKESPKQRAELVEIVGHGNVNISDQFFFRSFGNHGQGENDDGGLVRQAAPDADSLRRPVAEVR